MDYLVLLENEEQIRNLAPEINLLKQFNIRGFIFTAPGNKADFVSRWFDPQMSVPEELLNGSAHCMLTPFWAERLNRHQLYAEQLSNRVGKIYCELKGDRVLLKGQAVLYMKGEINL